ncbi:MAG: hypothetical protein JST85_30530 [Acidobacteria bacterium]|nr:hypothetical protein [Acidobacteriota bacterium]
MSIAVNTLASAGKIYEFSSSAMTTRHRVGWPELGAVSRDLKGLERKLGDEAHEDYWGLFIRSLRRYVFLISSTPLAPGDPAIYSPGLIERLNNHLRQVHLLYPNLAGVARDLLERFSSIVNLGGNPLLEELERIYSTRQWETAALVLKETRFIPAVELTLRSVASLAGVKAVGAHHLRGDNCFDNIIVLGAQAWYPEYIFTAPRTRNIHIVIYSWLKSSWKPEPTFISSLPGDATSNRSFGTIQREDYDEEVEAENLLGAEDLLPRINLDAISERFARNHEVEREYEMVDAKLFTLEGGASVFIEASDNAKALVIDPDGDKDGRGASSRLRRLPVSYIEPGAYLLLRTCGGGDYIVPVADRILGGDKAKQIRACQELWKRRLREEVSRMGLFPASIALLDLGSIRAEESNVRNWMSSRNIRPDDRRDFEAIMKLAGLEDRIDEYWMNAKSLTTAHMSAGRYIRRLLLNGVATAGLDELERTGRMDFELPGEDAGSFTAFRVLDVSTKKYKVPVAHLDEPFESEADLWPE